MKPLRMLCFWTLDVPLSDLKFSTHRLPASPIDLAGLGHNREGTKGLRHASITLPFQTVVFRREPCSGGAEQMYPSASVSFCAFS